MTLVDSGLKIHGFHLDDVAVLVVGGEADRDTAQLLRAAFDTLHPHEYVYVDCFDVGFVASEGLAPLCQLARRNVIAGGPLHVRASAALRRIVEISGVEHLFAFD